MRNNCCVKVFRMYCPNKTAPQREVTTGAVWAAPWRGWQLPLTYHPPVSLWSRPLLALWSPASATVLLVTASMLEFKSLILKSEGLGLNFETASYLNLLCLGFFTSKMSRADIQNVWHNQHGPGPDLALKGVPEAPWCARHSLFGVGLFRALR